MQMIQFRLFLFLLFLLLLLLYCFLLFLYSLLFLWFLVFLFVSIPFLFLLLFVAALFLHLLLLCHHFLFRILLPYFLHIKLSRILNGYRIIEAKIKGPAFMAAIKALHLYRIIRNTEYNNCKDNSRTRFRFY